MATKMIEAIKKYTIFFNLFLGILFPISSFGFSEAEMEALGETGETSLSSRPWRVDFNFLLQRNFKVDVYLQDAFNLDKKHSLFNNWFWGAGFKFSYSLRNFSDALRKTEVFLDASIMSPFEGYDHLLKGYSARHYFGYALQNPNIGVRTPFYKIEETLLSYVNVYFSLPISKFSGEATLWTTLGGSLDFLWFIRKESEWSLALFSTHGAGYHHFTNANDDPSGEGKPNKFLTVTNSVGPVFRQTYNPFLPASVGIYALHDYAIDTDITQDHFLNLGGSVSWKLRKQLYFKFLVYWRDIVYKYNHKNPRIKKTDKRIYWFDSENTVWRLSLSYSF